LGQARGEGPIVGSNFEDVFEALGGAADENVARGAVDESRCDARADADGVGNVIFFRSEGKGIAPGRSNAPPPHADLQPQRAVEGRDAAGHDDDAALAHDRAVDFSSTSGGG
jgi:hypothetical protein